jgi:hypothetical protein
VITTSVGAPVPCESLIRARAVLLTDRRLPHYHPVPPHPADAGIPTDPARERDDSYRNFAAAVLRRALDDLAIPRERRSARRFLERDYATSLWAEWLGPVDPALLARAIRVGVRRRSTVDTPRQPHVTA